MASVTIRNLDDDVKRRLRIRAAERGRSMEAEIRDILTVAVGRGPAATDTEAVDDASRPESEEESADQVDPPGGRIAALAANPIEGYLFADLVDIPDEVSWGNVDDETLDRILDGGPPNINIGLRLRRTFGTLGGVELDLPPRNPARYAVFDE